MEGSTLSFVVALLLSLAFLFCWVVWPLTPTDVVHSEEVEMRNFQRNDKYISFTIDFKDGERIRICKVPAVLKSKKLKVMKRTFTCMYGYERDFFYLDYDNGSLVIFMIPDDHDVSQRARFL